MTRNIAVFEKMFWDNARGSQYNPVVSVERLIFQIVDRAENILHILDKTVIIIAGMSSGR